ncbi:retinoschisin-like [Oculina patagonica]
MESGAILDSQITASSEYGNAWAAHLARLHLGGCWVARPSDNNQWLQVDLQQKTRITRIATQGRVEENQWVTEYKLQYGEDGQIFTFYRGIADNSDTIFQGNTDRQTVVDHDLDPIIEARYIRVLPTKWRNWISMKMELYGC